MLTESRQGRRRGQDGGYKEGGWLSLGREQDCSDSIGLRDWALSESSRVLDVIDFLHLCLLPAREVMYMCRATCGEMESRPIGVGMVAAI